MEMGWETCKDVNVHGKNVLEMSLETCAQQMRGVSPSKQICKDF